MSQKLTILFDLDGTLIDTAPDLMSAHNYVMKKFGFKEKKREDIKKLAGKGSREMLRRSVYELNHNNEKNKKILDEMTIDFINFYKNNICNESRLSTGLLNFLNWCKKNSILMGVCTNKQENLSIDLLKKIKIYDFFEYVAGGDTFQYNKPDPRHLTSVIEIIGGKVSKAIMIGDSETDSNASKSAGIPFILIKGGYTEKKIEEIYHDHAVGDFSDIEKIIKKYIND